MISYHGKHIKLTRHNMWSYNDFSNAINFPTEFSGIAIDSRNVQSGNIFIGIKGPNHDGGVFSRKAIENGAILCITHFIPKDSEEFSEKFLIVKNTYETLLSLAKYNREKKYINTTFIGVTGSVGKTTTKEMLNFVLPNSHANKGNLNNEFGLPLSLANLTKCDYGIFEMGMSARGEISYLSNILKPNIGIITSVAPAHMEFFNNIDEIAAAKAEILYGMNNGYLIVNLDIPGIHTILNSVKPHIKVIGYSLHDITYNIFGKIKIKNIEIESLHTIVTIEYDVKNGKLGELDYIIGGVGHDLIMNSLAVLATLIATHQDLNYMNKLKDFSSLNGRGKVKTIDNLQIQLINEAYNANPTSLAFALNRLNQLSQHSNYKRKIAIIGDMLELGQDEIEMHKAMLEHIMQNDIDKVFCVGQRMKHLFDILNVNKQGLWCETSQEMMKHIKNHLQPFDMVMVKGSNSMNMMSICNMLEE